MKKEEFLSSTAVNSPFVPKANDNHDDVETRKNNILQKMRNKLQKKYLLKDKKNKILNGVLIEMTEEQPEKRFVPNEDVKELISTLENQRNLALNRCAVEQARNKSLLKAFTDQAEELKQLEKKYQNTLNLLDKLNQETKLDGSK